MSNRLRPSPVLLVCLFLGLLVVPTRAQEWQQEVQIITTVRPGEPIYVFLDSLSAVLDRTPDARLRRSAERIEGQSYDELRNALLDEGMDLTSASHAFIRYRFALNNQGTRLVESIEDIYFISRFDENYTDLPILYVSTQDPLVSDALMKRGIPNIVNLKSITTFRELLAFPFLHKQQETAMVEFGGRPLRDNFLPQRETLLEFLTNHTTLGSGAYDLTTRYEQTMQSALNTTTAASLQ